MATFEGIKNSSSLEGIFDNDMHNDANINQFLWADGETKLNAANLNRMSTGISGLQKVVNETFPKIKSILSDIVSSGITDSERIKTVEDNTTFIKTENNSIAYVKDDLADEDVLAVSIGQQIIASGKLSFVHGKYNLEDPNGNYAHVVGNGDSSQRSNAYTLDWSGNAWYAGGITSEGNISSKGNISSDGTIFSEGGIGSNGNISIWGTISSKGGILLEKGVNYGTITEMNALTGHDGQLFVVIQDTVIQDTQES